MSKDSILKQKSMVFAKRIVQLYQFLTREKQEYVMAKQLLRSGTSIGANITEAVRILLQSCKLQGKRLQKHYIGWSFFTIATISLTNFMHLFAQIAANCYLC